MIFRFDIGNRHYIYGLVTDVFDYIKKNWSHCDIGRIVPFPSDGELPDNQVLVEVVCNG